MIPNVEEDLKRSQSSSAFSGSSFLPNVEKDLQRAQQNAEAARVAEEERLAKQAEREQQISEIEASGEPYIKAIEPTLLDKLTDIWTAADTSTWGITQNIPQFFESMPEAVPEYNEEGDLTGVRLETEGHVQKVIRVVIPRGGEPAHHLVTVEMSWQIPHNQGELRFCIRHR
jgi:hypothetical protein